MWNMMCDVMPTISEDSISQRSSQFSGEDANFEQLMVSMLDERDKLMDSLRETQERLSDTELKLADVEKERDSLQRQIAANLPQVSEVTSAHRAVHSTLCRVATSVAGLCDVPDLGSFIDSPPAKLQRHFNDEISILGSLIFFSINGFAVRNTFDGYLGICHQWFITPPTNPCPCPYSILVLNGYDQVNKRPTYRYSTIGKTIRESEARSEVSSKETIGSFSPFSLYLYENELLKNILYICKSCIPEPVPQVYLVALDNDVSRHTTICPIYFVMNVQFTIKSM
ncbi:hypothetical protein FQR65_LT09521 [Abscondita terminalis]|nr:hypothetical protein FQR65_LT09521 [Abscondita terminalis]